MSPESFKRKLTAILSADVKGYSRLMGEDEAETVKTLTAYRKIMGELIQQHRGRVIDCPGDNILAEFASVVDAVQCSVAAQNEFKTRNAELPENRRMEFRIGVNLGDVIEEENRIYGDGVNIAARLEALADPGGICISKTAFDHIESKLPLGYEYLGEQTVKNITKPVGAYKVLMEPRVVVAGAKDKKPSIPVWRRKGVLAGAVAVLIVIIGMAVWNFYFRAPRFEPASKEKMALPLPDKPSIAVLPFVNMSSDREQDYFSDGITEEIITALSKTPKIFVIARNSSFTYKGKPVKVQQVGRELGVKYVLEGSIQKAEEKVRITAQLVDATTGNHLWAERYDRDLKDIFALEDEITMKILTALQVKLTEGEQARAYGKGTQNLEAYLLCLQAEKEITRMNKDGLVRARQMLQQATTLDPSYARVYHLLALSYVDEVILALTTEPKQSLARGVELEHKALALDDSLSWGHALLGWLYTLQGQHDKGIAECEEAVRLEPNSAAAYFYLSLALKYAGRAKESIAMSNEAIRLDPIPISIYYQSVTTTYCLTGQYKEAITAGEKAVELGPNNMVAHAFLAVAYSLNGNEEEAGNEAKEVMRINPKFSVDEWAKTMPFKNKADKDLIIAALRKAGLK
jgi:adenylate cyclase